MGAGMGGGASLKPPHYIFGKKVYENKIITERCSMYIGYSD
jgi:hypothetical protein